MRNPTVQSMLTNPRALDAMQQVMQGMQTLNSEAPGLFPKYVYVTSVQIKSIQGTKNVTVSTYPAYQNYYIIKW